MQTLNDFKNSGQIENNIIYVNPEQSVLKNSKVNFKGENNILFVEDGVTLENSTISFSGDNCVVYLSSSNKVYYLSIDVYQSSAVFFGRNSYLNGAVHAIASEGQNIIVGNDCLFSFGIWIRTADPHLVYSVETHKRLNYSKSVFIGDHVWIGQNALVLKGCRFGSGSILGGGAVASNKLVPSNTSFAGNPAKLVGRGVFYDGRCVHNWTSDDTEKNATVNSDKWIYKNNGKTLDVKLLDEELKRAENVEKKLEVLKSSIVANTDKNRFFVADTVKVKSNKKGIKEFIKAVLRKIKSVVSKG